MPDDNPPNDDHHEPDVTDDENVNEWQTPELNSDQPPFEPGIAPFDDSDLSEQHDDQVGPPDDDELPVGYGRRIANPRNLNEIGVLRLHYPARTINVAVDGDAAMRAMTAFNNENPSGLEDILRASSDARAAWVSFDFRSLLAMEWMPGLPRRSSERMAVDPVSAAR